MLASVFIDNLNEIALLFFRNTPRPLLSIPFHSVHFKIFGSNGFLL